MKQNILCICTMGENRSKYFATYLRNKGYKTRWGGVGPCRVDPAPTNPVKEKDIEWADVIITARPKHELEMKKKFNIKNKKLIILDVCDSRKKIGEIYPELNFLDKEVFNKKWTYPQLRKSIKPYLPLEK